MKKACTGYKLKHFLELNLHVFNLNYTAQQLNQTFFKLRNQANL